MLAAGTLVIRFSLHSAWTSQRSAEQGHGTLYRVRHPSFLARISGLYRAIALFWMHVCVLFLVANLVAAGVLMLRARRSVGAAPAYVTEALERSFPELSEEQRLELWRESARDFTRDVVVQYRESPFSGSHVNVDAHGFRRVANQGPWPPQDRHYNVFLFGGSTAFGYGVRDADTIASHLQDLLSLEGRPVRVYNFARGGFYSTPERLLFEKLVTLGMVPDLAVFIDGLNDFFFDRDPPAFTLGLTRLTEEELRRPVMAALRQLPVVRAFEGSAANLGFERPDLAGGRAGGNAATDASEAEAVERVIGRYVGNKGVAEAVGAAYGVQVLFVWQPVPTYKYDLRYHTFSGSFGRHERSRLGYPRMHAYAREHPLGENFVWCADIQDRVEALLYVDQVHYSPAMSRLVAQCISDAIRERDLLR
jgi:hypothetical protein